MNRRTFLRSTACGYSMFLTKPLRSAPKFNTRLNANDEPGIGYIGTGIRYHSALNDAMSFGSGSAIADVDMIQLGRAVQVARTRQRQNNRPITISAHEDYRSVLDNKSVDVVFIASPDHWHTKQAIDAMRAGKDVYCEKPLTLTIEEGEQLEKVMKKTGRILQVGTQQRTQFNQRFAKAAAIVRSNRLGKLKQVTCAIGGSRTCDPLPEVRVPKNLNWDLWQGQAPTQKYRSANKVVDTGGWGAGHPFSRTHRYYRWFYEYSGGKLTDWGAHHLDIALLAIDKLNEDIGKVKIEVISNRHPVEFDDKGMPLSDDRFNCATAFKVKLTFADDTIMFVRDSAQDLGFDNGIMFEGDEGRILVNRGKLVGRPVEDLTQNPLDSDWYFQLFGQSAPKSHIAHFFDCVRSRETPISDLKSHNYMLNICHAINISLRLNRNVIYDPAARNFGSYQLANNMIGREQRKGFETDV